MNRIYDVARALKKYAENGEHPEEQVEEKDGAKATDESTDDADKKEDAITPNEAESKPEDTNDENKNEIKSDKPAQSEIAKNNEDNKKQVQQVGKTVMSTQDQLTEQLNALDNAYKNRYLEKYGKEMKDAYNTTGVFIKKAMGISLLTIILLLCSNNIIPIKKVLSKYSYSWKASFW